MKQRHDLKILLLQIRDDEETMQEEYLEFVEYADLHESQLDVLNTFRTPEFEPKVIDQYDALFVGGSSDASVLKPEAYPFVDNCKKLLRYCYEKNIPVFASCFGFQIVVEEMDAKVELDEKNMEMGVYQIELTEAATSDALLHDCPRMFDAVSGHKERAISLPPDAILLAKSEKCPYHLFRLDDKPFYAFQFHPEVNTKDLVARISRYKERYLENSAELSRIIEQAKATSTPISNGLVKKFVDRIILPAIASHS